MKKSYQKRLDKVENDSGDCCAEIQDLDSILALPHPLRELSFVHAVCDGHRNPKKRKSKARAAPLEKWIDSNGQCLDSKN